MSACYPRRWRSAFTLIELLVTICIIGILLALLIPAVQSARESARRVQCQNNLRQWGIAFNDYESLKERFPCGYRFAVPSGTFVATLLPYIGRSDLGYDTDRDWRDPVNRPGIQTQLPLMVCPTAPGRHRVGTEWGDLRPAAGDYTATHGVNHEYCQMQGWPLLDPPDQNGVLTDQPCPRAQIKDGLSQTFLLQEDAGRPELWKMGTRSAAEESSAAGWADPNYEIALDGSDTLLTGGGQKLGPCFINCTNDNEAYSFHHHGVYCLMADGAVRWIDSALDAKVFAALSTRAASDGPVKF
jgi:prepilin-type N-terminal cleavage/methylation domain-containing protein